MGRIRQDPALRKQEARLGGPLAVTQWLNHNLKWVRPRGEADFQEVITMVVVSTVVIIRLCNGAVTLPLFVAFNSTSNFNHELDINTL